MKTNSLFWALTWAAAGSLAVMQGCGGDDDDGGDGGDDDKGGSSGSGGTTGGSSGSGGKGGTSGSSGSAGKGGTGGTAPTGGAGGAPGGQGGEGGNVSGGEGGGGTADPERIAQCGVYCTSYFTNGCNTFATDTYDDQPTCQSTCQDASWPIGAPGIAGDTIFCRQAHAAMATGADQELHCGHASENPTAVCVD